MYELRCTRLKRPAGLGSPGMPLLRPVAKLVGLCSTASSTVDKPRNVEGRTASIVMASFHTVRMGAYCTF